MKVIDLLNKIANGDETIKKIKYDNQIFEYREDMLDYYCFDYDLNLMGYQKCLNDEIEIIEEHKIEKIGRKFNLGYVKCNINEEAKDGINKAINEIYSKIDEIIDKLNEME